MCCFTCLTWLIMMYFLIRVSPFPEYIQILTVLFDKKEDISLYHGAENRMNDSKSALEVAYQS